MKRLQGRIEDTIYSRLEPQENETKEEYIERIDDFGYALEASLLTGNTQEKFGLSKTDAGRLSIVANYIILKHAYGKPCLTVECPLLQTLALAKSQRHS
jgi:hypothetical protein